MSDALIIGAGVAAFPAAILAGLGARLLHDRWVPTGQHRAARVADMAPLADLLAAGQLDSNDTAWCAECSRSTYHALHTDGSRTCWTCRTDTPAGA